MEFFVVFFVGFVLWLVLSIVVGFGAKNRNRSFWGFLILSIMFSPIISFLILVILGENKERNY